MSYDTRKQFEMFEQLRQDGWHIFNMKEFEPRIFEVVTWCRDNLGPMLTIYDIDSYNCKWHGGQIEVHNTPYPGGVMTLFAFKDPADFTMLKLKFA